MTTDCEVAVLGAGPYGLAVASHLRRAGVDTQVFGRPMSFWRERMPAGMLLRSNWGATNIADLHGDLTLDAYQADTGASFATPVPLADFVGYGMWFQRHAVPDLDTRLVARIERSGTGFRLVLEDGRDAHARRVVVSAGINSFAAIPAELASLPPHLVSHASAHSELGTFAGMDVLVVGGGQSALESAALLHEAGAEVEVLVRAPHMTWLRGGTTQKRLGRAKPLFYGPTDVGPLGISRLLSNVGLSRRLPRPVLTPLARRAIRPAGSRWLVDRLVEVPLTTGRTVSSARELEGGVELTLDDGSTRTVAHVLCGTGYRVDLGRYDFLPPALLDAVERVDGYPRLGKAFESSVPGLHFVGAPSAWSYGPVMRFVSGTWYTGRVLARTLGARKPARDVVPEPARAA